MLYRILKWFKGYLILNINNGSPERFFNVCRKRERYIWDISADKHNYYFKISLRDYRKINDVAYKCKTYPWQVKRIGFPFVLDSLLKKKTLLPAFCLFIFTLLYMSGFVWDIHVSGQCRYTKEALLEYMDGIGLKKYMRINSLDADYVEKQMRLDYKDIGWVSVSLDGTNVYVKILESDMPDINNSDEVASDIVASENGIVKSIITRKGIPMVHAGDKVEKGQTLVKGLIELYDDSGNVISNKAVMADADITLQVRKKYKNSFKLIHDKKHYTGRSKTEYTICSEKNYIFIENILNKFESYEKYDIINECMSTDFIYKKTLNEYEIIGETYTKNEALQLAKINLKDYLNKLISDKVEIIDKDIKVRFDKGICKSSGWIDMLIIQDNRKIFTMKDWGVEQHNEQN